MTLLEGTDLVSRLVEVDVNGLVDEHGIRYLGTARKQPDGTWRCLADVGGALCLVEVKLTVPERVAS